MPQKNQVNEPATPAGENPFAYLLDEPVQVSAQNPFAYLLDEQAPKPEIHFGSQDQAEVRKSLGLKPPKRASEQSATQFAKDLKAAGFTVQQWADRDVRGKPGTKSKHATGEALDVFGNLDDALTRALANPNASYVIYNRHQWKRQADGKWSKSRYKGAHPHHDHVHVETQFQKAIDKAFAKPAAAEAPKARTFGEIAAEALARKGPEASRPERTMELPMDFKGSPRDVLPGPAAPNMAWETLPFSRQAYEKAITTGGSYVETKSGGKQRIESAKTALRRRGIEPGYDLGVTQSELEEQQLLQDAKRPKAPRAPGSGLSLGENIVRSFRSWMDPELGPPPQIADGVVRFAGALLDSPVQGAGDIARLVSDPVGYVQGAPKMVAEFAQMLNFLEPGLSVSDRVERVLWAGLAGLGGWHSGKVVLSAAKRKGWIKSAAAELGVPESEAVASVEAGTKQVVARLEGLASQAQTAAERNAARKKVAELTDSEVKGLEPEPKGEVLRVAGEASVETPPEPTVSGPRKRSTSQSKRQERQVDPRLQMAIDAADPNVSRKIDFEDEIHELTASEAKAYDAALKEPKSRAAGLKRRLESSELDPYERTDLTVQLAIANEDIKDIQRSFFNAEDSPYVQRLSASSGEAIAPFMVREEVPLFGFDESGELSYAQGEISQEAGAPGAATKTEEPARPGLSPDARNVSDARSGEEEGYFDEDTLAQISLTQTPKELGALLSREWANGGVDNEPLVASVLDHLDEREWNFSEFEEGAIARYAELEGPREAMLAFNVPLGAVEDAVRSFNAPAPKAPKEKVSRPAKEPELQTLLDDLAEQGGSDITEEFKGVSDMLLASGLPDKAQVALYSYATDLDITDPAELAPLVDLAKQKGKSPVYQEVETDKGFKSTLKSSAIANPETDPLSKAASLIREEEAKYGSDTPEALPAAKFEADETLAVGKVGAVLEGYEHLGKTLTELDSLDVLKARAASVKDAEPPTLSIPREQDRKAWARTLMKNAGLAEPRGKPPVLEKGKKAYILLGGPGSGKSTLLKQLLPNLKAVLIDADEAKKLIPEFDGSNTSRVHDESAHIVEDLVLPEAYKRDYNVAIQKIGKREETVTKIIASLESQGYRVALAHLDVPPSVAAKDALKRWRESEEVRFVDPNYILNDIGETPKQSFSVLSNGHSKLYATETWKRSGSGFRVEARVRLAGVSRGNGQGNRASRVTDAKEVRSPDEESTARLSGGASKRQRPVLRQPSNRNLVTASGKRIRTVKDLLEVSPDDPRLDPDNIAFDPALSSAIGRYLGQGSRKVRAELRKARERAEKAYLARDLAKDSYADVAEEFEGFKGGKRPEAGAEIYIPWKRHSLKIGSGWRPPNLPSMVERAYFADTFSPHVRAMLDEFASSHYREPEVVLMRKVDSDSARISKRHVPSSVSASLSGPPPGGKRPSELALQDQGGKAQRYPESLIRDFMAYYGFDNPPSLLDYLASELGIDKRDLNEKVVLTPREASRAEAAKKLAAQTLKEQEKARNYNKLQALDEAMSSGEVSKAEYAKSRVSLLASGLEIKGVKSSAAKRVIDNALKDAAITKREHGLLMEAKSASAQKKRLTRGAITVPKKAPPPSGYVRGMSLWQFKRTLKTAEDKAKATVLWEKARRDHYSQKPAVTLAGDHLRTAPNLGKLDLRGLRRRSEEAIFTTYEAAKYARHLLEEEMGENLKGSRLDAELALSEQTRNSGRVQLFVERGFHNEKGEKLTLGLPEIKQLIPGDVEQWQEYRRALRENELSQRGERPITPERVAANQHVVDSYLESIDKEALAAADREFDKFAYHQLKLYEEYGLRAEGWADEIRLENQAYFPMVRASLLDDLSDLNPLTVASPESTVKRAHGGEHYADGLAAMAERTERIIRAGELNKAMLPFVDEAAKHENLSWMATEITQDVNLHRSLESNAKLRDKLDLAITKSALHLERLRQRLLQPELDLDPFKKQTLEEDYHNALVTLEDLEARLSAVSDPDGQQLPDPFPGGLPVEGVEPIFTVRDKGVERVFRLDKDLWNAVRGLQPQVRPLWFRFFEGFARVARAGTTKYNPLFRLLFNVLIDVPSAVIVHGLNPLRLGKGFVTAAKGWNSGEYIQAVMNKVVTDAKGASDFVDQQWLYEPTTRSRVQQKADKLMEIQGIRVMADGAKAGLRAFERASQVIEETTRLAMYQQKAAKYMKDGMPELEAKRRAAADSASLIDFGEAGEFLRWVGRVTPYAAVKPQVIMSIARGIRREPLKFTMRAIGLITVPKMIEYMMYKDDAEYKKLPRYVKDGSFVFKKPGGGWLALRAPGELMVLFGGIPRRIMESEGDAGKAAAEIAGSLAKEYTTAAIPTFAAALGQQVTYLNSGGVFDARFWSFKRPPTPDGEPGHRYEQFVQQTDTLLGSLGRLGARNVGYFLGEEKEPPNPLQRFAPEPEKGSSKRRKTPSYKGKRKNPFAPSGPPKPSFKPGF